MMWFQRRTEGLFIPVVTPQAPALKPLLETSLLEYGAFSSSFHDIDPSSDQPHSHHCSHGFNPLIHMTIYPHAPKLHSSTSTPHPKIRAPSASSRSLPNTLNGGSFWNTRLLFQLATCTNVLVRRIADTPNVISATHVAHAQKPGGSALAGLQEIRATRWRSCVVKVGVVGLCAGWGCDLGRS